MAGWIQDFKGLSTALQELQYSTGSRGEASSANPRLGLGLGLGQSSLKQRNPVP